MTNSSSWSNASAACRLEWRPSPAFAWLVRIAGGLAALAPLNSQLGWGAALPLAAAALAWSMRLATSLASAPPLALVLPHDALRPARVDGGQAAALTLAWRGPLVVLRGVDARGGRFARVGLPDCIDACMRRELRLAWRARQPARPTASMAP